MKKSIKIIITVCISVLVVFVGILTITGGFLKKGASISLIDINGSAPEINYNGQKTLTSSIDNNAPTINGEITTDTGRKIAISDYLTIQVDNLESSAKKAEETTKQFGGYIENYNVDNSGSYPSGTYTLKVPSDRIDAFVDEIKKLGTYKTGGRNAQDLTTAVININAQLDTLYAEEKVYISFFNKAKTVKEMLDIQQSIQQVRSQIESLEGQKKYYDNITSYASVQLTLLQKAANTEVNKPVGFITAFKNSIENFKAGYASFLTWLGGNIITLIISLFVISAIILIIKKRSSKNN